MRYTNQKPDIGYQGRNNIGNKGRATSMEYIRKSSFERELLQSLLSVVLDIPRQSFLNPADQTCIAGEEYYESYKEALEKLHAVGFRRIIDPPPFGTSILRFGVTDTSSGE